MGNPLRVLMVEDSEDDVLLTIHSLRKGGYDPVYERVEDAGAMRNALEKGSWDVILCDYRMPKFSGLAAIALLKETGIDIPLIIVSGAIGEEMAAECMRSGARDFFMKGKLFRLALAVERELKEEESRRQRKQADEKLRRSEQRYRLLVENASEAIVVVQDGKAKFVNRGIEWAGYTPEEYMSIPVMETIHPEDREAVAHRYLQKINGDTTPTRHAYRGLEKSGRIHWIEVSSVLIDWEGKPATLNLLTDITDRKRAEEKLSTVVQHLSAHIDNSPLAVVEFDSQFRVIRWSKESERVFGWTAEEVLGRAISEIRWVYEEDEELVRRESADLLSGQRSRSLHVNRNYRKDGSVISCEWYNSGIYDSSGSLISIHSLVLDITDKKKIEEELRESQELFSLFMRHSPVYTFIKEVTPDESRVLQASDNYEQMIGIPGPEMIGRTMRELFPPELAAKITADDWAVVSNGNVLQLEEDFNGRHFTTIKFPLVRREKPLLAGYTIDITDRKQAEDEVRLNEARLASLLRICQHKAETIQELLDFALDEAIMLTGSKIGYIYYYNDQKKEFTLNTWSKDVMKECSIAEPQAIYRLDKTGILGEAVRQARPMVVNDFQAPHPLKKGYPEGHAPLYKFLTLPIFSADRIVAVVAVANKQTDYDESDIRQLTLMMDSVWRIADRTRVELELVASEKRLRKTVNMTIQAMVSSVETRDPYTSGHQNRSADLARTIATEMGLSQEKIEGIRMAGSIHDIGKLSIPAEILSKPTKLSALEFLLIQEHARQGYEILKNVESSWPLAEMVYQHHERMDGSGYPRKLKGDEILVEARIITVADVVESMTSHRPYRPALGLNVALEEIENNKGTLYDADAVDACLRLFREKGYRLAEV
jgi:PAS domain S-box-containing protein